MQLSGILFLLTALLFLVAAAPVEQHPVASSSHTLSSTPSRGRVPTRKNTADRGRPQRKTTGSGSRQSNRDGSVPKPWHAHPEYAKTELEAMPCKKAKFDPTLKCNKEHIHCGTQGSGVYDHNRNADEARIQSGKLKMIKIMGHKISIKKLAHEIKGLVLVEQFLSCQYYESTTMSDDGNEVTDRQYFLFMKKMPGVPLSQLPQLVPGFSALQTDSKQQGIVANKIKEALIQYAEKYNVGHRDVMPRNILVDGTDPEHCSVSLVDWAQWDWINPDAPDDLQKFKEKAETLARIAMSSAPAN